MENKKILSSTSEIFTLSLIFVSAFNLLLSGEKAEMRGLSALFALCGEGLSFVALGQLLLLSFVIALLRFVWFSDRFMNDMMMIYRVTLMLVSVFVTAGAFSAAFGWFPLGMWQAWLGFAVSFAIGTIVSFAVMYVRVKMQSRRYEQNLTVYKEKNRKGDD